MTEYEHNVGHLHDLDYEAGWYWWREDEHGAAISPPHGPFDTAGDADDAAWEDKERRRTMIS